MLSCLIKTGYPRFKVHYYCEYLFKVLLEMKTSKCDVSNKMCYVMPSNSVSSRLRIFLQVFFTIILIIVCILYTFFILSFLEYLTFLLKMSGFQIFLLYIFRAVQVVWFEKLKKKCNHSVNLLFRQSLIGNILARLLVLDTLLLP